MKALPPRPPVRSARPFRLGVLICLCAVAALALTLPQPSAQAADFSVYGGGGGGGGGIDGAGGAGGAGGDGSPGGKGGTGSDGGGGGGGGGGGTGTPGGNGGNGNAGGNGSGGAGGVDMSGHGGQGGAGGMGGTGGPGGNGGGGTSATSNASFATAKIGGGDGGNGGDNSPSGIGGNGGNAHANVIDSSVGALSIDGGNGGDGGVGSSAGGNGGNGGDATANLTGSSFGALSMRSGKAGAASGTGGPGGKGGDAFLTADTLRTGSIVLTKNDGGLSLNINGPLVWTGDGAFKLMGNGATIDIGSLTIDGGTVNADNYGNLISADSFYADKAITLGDKGATFDTGGGDQNVGRALTGAGSLTKTGTGTLTLTGDNSYTGGTTISGGTLSIGSDDNIGGGTNTIGGDGTLLLSGDGTTYAKDWTLGGAGSVIATDNDNTLSGTLSGTGGLTKKGAGTLTLTGDNAYSGDTTINAGTLKGNIAKDTNLSIAAGAKYDGAKAARTVNALNGEGVISNTNGLTVQSGTFGGVIDASNASLIKDGTGTLTLTGNNAYTGTTTIKAGTLKGNIADNTDLDIASGAAYDGAGKSRSVNYLEGKGTIRNTDGLTAQRGTFGGVIDASNTSLTIDGFLALTGDNTYTGGTTIKTGILRIGNGGTTGSVKGDIVNNGMLTFERSDNLTYDGNISGTGMLGKLGVGTLELTGVNTYSGDTLINEGTLKGNIADNTNVLIAPGAAYDGANMARSVNALTGEGAIRNTNGLTVRSGDFGGDIDASNAGLIKDGTGTLTLTGNNAYTGTTTIKAGTLALSGGGTLGASSLLDLRGGGLDISGITPASLALPDLDVRGPALLNIGDKTADFSGKLLSFYVPSDMGAGGTLLSVGGAGTTDIAGSTVRVGVAGASSPLGEGDAVILIDAAGGTLQGGPANASSKGEGMQGVTLRYEFDIATIGNRLTATVAGAPQADPRSKALSEGFLGGMALSLQGADLAAGRGMESAARASSQAGGGTGGYGFAGFGALSGGSQRYNTGSHVDMDSLSMLTGFAWGADLAPGRLTLGAFFEYGNGSYDTYNSFGNAASVHGDGDAHYLGGGVLARMDFAPAGPGHAYAEASARAGKTHNDYGSSDLRDAAGRKADYDSASPYYGLHGGVGYVWSIDETTSLDLYGKYFWTRQEGDGVKLSTGESLRFGDVDSSRLRFGGRFAYTVNEYVAPYVGAAWEHEFDGKARATSNGFALDAPDLRGDTGIGEIGFSLTPSSGLPLTIDLGVQGYAGKREGVTGNLQVKWEF